ncbi:MAG: GntR family transcriptional regulator [Candidatus Dormiibacterota bacterium]
MPSENRVATHPYEEVAGALRDAILGGRLKTSDRVPSEWELAAEYRTSRPTVRRAIALLKSEGLVVTEQGRGTFVRPPPRVQLRVVGSNFRRHRAEGRSAVPGLHAEAAARMDAPLRPRRRRAARRPIAVVIAVVGLAEGADRCMRGAI